MSKAVFCIVPSQYQAENIVSRLKTAGFADYDISMLFPDKSGTHDFAHVQNTKAPEGAAAGASTGGVVGGAAGLLAGLGALAIPGLGPFIAAGPLLAALSGAAIGAAVGGLTGALVGMGIPEIEARAYEGKIRSGNIVLSVHANDKERIDLAKKIFEVAGGTDIVVGGEKNVPKEEDLRRHA